MSETWITGIAHYGLRVADLERSKGFYEKLGFRFALGPVGTEPVAIMKHPAGIELNLVINASQQSADNILMDVPTKYAGYTHVALEVNNLDQVLERLQRASIELSGGPESFPNGGRAVFIRDPDRNVIELHERGRTG